MCKGLQVILRIMFRKGVLYIFNATFNVSSNSWDSTPVVALKSQREEVLICWHILLRGIEPKFLLACFRKNFDLAVY